MSSEDERISAEEDRFEVLGECDDNSDEEANEMDFRRLMSQGNSSSSLLSANCFEFDRYQWETLVFDHTNKEIAIAMRNQGEARYSDQGDSDSKVNQKYLFEKGILYQFQREVMIERLEKGFDGKRDRNPKLSQIMPVYVAPPIIEIKVNVTCQVMNAAPKTKKVAIKREEGLVTAIRKSKEAHKGLPLKNEYELIFMNSNEIVTEEDFCAIEDGTDLKLQEIAAATPSSKSGKVAKSSASSKKSAQVASPPVQQTANATVTQRRLENSKRLLSEDVDRMILPISSNIKMHERMSLLVYLLYWGAYTLNGLNGLLRDAKSNLIEVNRKDSIDCLISLQRSIRDLRGICPYALVADAEAIDRLLTNKIQSLNINLLTLVAEDYPELIDKSSYDSSTPKINRLYEEQGQVLDIIHEKLLKDEPCVVGYRVPPSGGKTILSVAIAAMMAMHHRESKKRLLYVCYNTLVRLSVANACEQAAIPFWVATTRTGARDGSKEGGKSAVATSFSCRDRSRAAMRKKKSQAIAAGDGSHKLGQLPDMMLEAHKLTVKWNPIIICDITSAYDLLSNGVRVYDKEKKEFYTLAPDDFVLYLDEPTAGAENGIGNVDSMNDKDKNKMQQYVAAIISVMPKQAVLLSATLPNLLTEFPSLGARRGKDIIMIETQRLPVGCVAIAPDGSQVLPHEISSNFSELQFVVRGLKTDALMQRFYTPGPVYKLSKEIEKVSKDKFPRELRFEDVIKNIGDISHKTIRLYAVDLLTWIASVDDEDFANLLFETVKSIAMVRVSMPVLAETFIVDHVASEGRALAVTTTYAAEETVSKLLRSKSDESSGRLLETLEELIAKAMSPYAKTIPNINELMRAFKAAKEEYTRQYESFLKAKDEEAALQLEAPSFFWPVQIAGFSASLSDEEISAMDSGVASNLLSGLGEYNPGKMTAFERNIVMREAGNGHLACLFSSPDIVYGTNMALITVFIGEGYGHIATRNSLYQLIGRAGRTGKSHKAKVLFQDMSTLRKALLPEPEGKNFEAEVMNWHLELIQRTGSVDVLLKPYVLASDLKP